MPSDAYLNQHERSPHAALALFFARTYNWQFAEWRDADFAALPADQVEALKAAIDDEARVTDGDVVRCTGKYYARMDPTQPAVACGSCGWQDVPMAKHDSDAFDIMEYRQVPLDSPLLGPLRYLAAEDSRYDWPAHIPRTAENEVLWRRYRRVISMVQTADGMRYHLLPEQVMVTVPAAGAVSAGAGCCGAASCGAGAAACHDRHTDGSTVLASELAGPIDPASATVMLCSKCYAALSGRRPIRPERSIAAGWDLGQPERANLPMLSLAEEFAIARTRLMTTALNVRIPRPGTGILRDNIGTYRSVKGHCICFPDHAAENAAEALPDPTLMGRALMVTLEGPPGLNRPRLDDMMMRNLGALSINADHVVDWLNALHFLAVPGGVYFDVKVRRSQDAATVLHNVRVNLVKQAAGLDVAVEDEVAGACARIGTTRGPMSDDADAESVPAAARAVRPRPDSCSQHEADDHGIRQQRHNASMMAEALVAVSGGDAPADAGHMDVCASASASNSSVGSQKTGSRRHVSFELASDVETGSSSGAAAGTCGCASVSGSSACGTIGAVKGLSRDATMPIEESAGAGSRVALGSSDEGLQDPLDGIELSGDLQTGATLLQERFPHNKGGEIAGRRRILQSIRVAVGAGEAPTPTLGLHREMEPLNDYLQQGRSLYGAFPTVFPLGEGIGNAIGPLPEDTRQWLLRHCCRRPARNQRLVHVLHNVKFRSDAGRVMAALVRVDPRPLEGLLATVSRSTFQREASVAEANPDTKEAKALVHELAPVIMRTGGHIPWSPLERGTVASVQALALTRFFGMPTVFITIGPDETRTVLVARMAVPGWCPGDPVMARGRSDTAADFWSRITSYDRATAGATAARTVGPADLEYADFARKLPRDLPALPEGVEVWRKEVGAAITCDPAAVALVCERMLAAFNECLVGVPEPRRRTKPHFRAERNATDATSGGASTSSSASAAAPGPTAPRGLFGRG